MSVPVPGKGYPKDPYGWDPPRKYEAPTTPPNPFSLLRPFIESWTIGFENQFDLLEQLQKAAKNKPSYPPYNIKELVEGEKYALEMAVAGFSKDDIKITVHENELLIMGVPDKASKSDNYVHKGIAARSFEQSFALGEYVEVDDASLDNGMLTIVLARNVPEDKKPKAIEIK